MSRRAVQTQINDDGSKASIEPALVSVTAEGERVISPAARPPTALTKRERDVLHWLSLGKSGYETAVILGISVCTVRVHTRNIMRKLDASNIPHAIARSFRTGVLPL